ncbi:hypothetical protein FNF07_13425 [Trinickia caryophylli]|nr:hypothetical protein C0Z17_19045 [Trinickia caryophylli]TRX19136.1 hypothetical protein FNF07_13425 [Trinickia caryophylli]
MRALKVQQRARWLKRHSQRTPFARKIDSVSAASAVPPLPCTRPRYAHLSADHLVQWVTPLTAAPAPMLAVI